MKKDHDTLNIYPAFALYQRTSCDRADPRTGKPALAEAALELGEPQWNHLAGAAGTQVRADPQQPYMCAYGTRADQDYFLCF